MLEAQEEVSKAQQFLMEAQKRHEERVAEVTEAERRLITLQTEAASHVTRDHEGPHSGFRPSRLGSRGGRIATEGEPIADRKHRAPAILQTLSSEHFTCGSARTPIEGGFVPGCDDDIFRWMQDRQADIQEATLAGNGHEVARLCHVMGSAVAGWSTPSLLPSMACNAVR